MRTHVIVVVMPALAVAAAAGREGGMATFATPALAVVVVVDGCGDVIMVDNMSVIQASCERNMLLLLLIEEGKDEAPLAAVAVVVVFAGACACTVQVVVALAVVPVGREEGGGMVPAVAAVTAAVVAVGPLAAATAFPLACR